MANFNEIITKNETMKALLVVAKKISELDISVLITGENGVGKRFLAESIHNFSNRYAKPFIIVNCASIPESVMEMELFGYPKGKKHDHISYLEQANGGTLFLNNPSFLPHKSQGILLKALESGKFIKGDGSIVDELNIRLISSCDMNLMNYVEEEKLRMDFYYRIKEITLDIPALRDRKDDIPLLANFFVKKFTKDFGKKIRNISDAAINFLKNYNWDGNVREFVNVMRTSVALCEKTTIWVEDIPLNIETGKKKEVAEADVVIESYALCDVEKKHILKTLTRCKWNKSRTARLLKISRPRLDRKIEEYQLIKPDK